MTKDHVINYIHNKTKKYLYLKISIPVTQIFMLFKGTVSEVCNCQKVVSLDRPWLKNQAITITKKLTVHFCN
jgi:hypothetical protein